MQRLLTTAAADNKFFRRKALVNGMVYCRRTPDIKPGGWAQVWRRSGATTAQIYAEIRSRAQMAARNDGSLTRETQTASS
jgi:hypothetical protein